MIKIVTIVGARPQIIKAAALSRAIKNKFANQITELIVHTGQHYDENMSKVFFDELGIPSPDYNLAVGSGAHGKQTAAMIVGIEEILVKEKPNAIVLYGDTNSTLAGAIAASKIHVPIIHIEAGLRSFNKAMPEEINRIMCDHASTLLFSPTKTGYDNLIKEGFNPKAEKPYNANNPAIYHCGDVMYDNSLYFAEIAKQNSDIIKRFKLNDFILATIHRNNNTDEPERLNALFGALNEISVKENKQVFLPLHPRTKHLLATNLNPELLKQIEANKLFIIAEPVSFLEMVALEQAAEIVMTDSGGVQKEAFYFKRPCVILRPETEWVELVNCGSAIIADADKKRVMDAYYELVGKKDSLVYPEFYGDGKACEFICQELVAHL